MSNVPRRKILTLILILILFLAALGVAGWTVISPSSLGLTQSPVTPTPGQPFALVILNKPSATSTLLAVSSPIPTILPVESQIPTATEPASVTQTPTVLETATAMPASESLVYAEIVADTPVPVGYSNTTQYDPPPAYSGNKYILVDISEQHMYIYEGDVLVNDFVASTGMNNATRAGHFSVLDKIPNAYGATWNIWMPNWLGIYWAGSMENGIHALPILPNGATLWAGYLGVPISYGCVVLGTYEAQWLYDWAEIGTPVEIRW